jgi:hydrogenase maturation protease
MRAATHILIAGVGNDLRQDDAFGIELARELIKRKALPPSVKVMEVGIGGIHLVQELHSNYDILIVLDAVEWGGEPGSVYLRELEEISDIRQMPEDQRRAFLADMHYTNPLRALMLAKALNVLPPKVLILGCEAARHDDFAIGMSEAAQAAIPQAVKKLESWVKENI